LTPFTAEGAVDIGALEREIDFMVGHCDAVSLLGAEASEYRLLADTERRRLLRHAVAAIDRRVTVLAGVSSPRVTEVAELAELAAEAGADLVQVLIPRRPWGPEAATGELVRYFEAIVRASPLPIVAYHNPSRGSDVSADTATELCRLDGIVAYKESSRDMTKVGRLVADIDRAGHAHYFTTMQPMLATLLQGGTGAMMPVPATVIGARLMAAFRAGDLSTARAEQAYFAGFPSRWAQYGLTPVMKAALRYLGIDSGDSGSGFTTLSAEDSAAIGVFLAEAGIATLAK
jgi:4-hydroxy-tetrahydrodipicolinate synthase